MSRIGDKPVVFPASVKITINNGNVTVAGPVGTVVKQFDPRVTVSVENGILTVKPVTINGSDAMQGTVRAIINNMVSGVQKKYEKKLEITGVGYKAQLAGSKLTLLLGYSHPVEFDIPKEIEAAVDPKGISITLKSPDKEKLGFFASQIRMSKSPDPYKAKGVKYAGERIAKKPGKSAIGAGGAGAAGSAGGGAKK
ncbi:MAG: 50S ribosomal protein L6 [Elusimicrobia bacterium ADurb.Bin231]|nr:MAG: 50S ribosomal protein L6 [Elusimicrobia bacterium ADurb.Bin231]